MISAQIRDWKVLLFAQILRQAPVGLYVLEYERAGGEGPLFQFQCSREPPHFYALQPKQIDERRDARLVGVRLDYETERRIRFTVFNRIARFLVKIFKDDFRELARQL